MATIDAHGNHHAESDGRFAQKPRGASAGSLDSAETCARCDGRFGPITTPASTHCVRCQSELSSMFAREVGVHREDERLHWGSVELVPGASVRGHDWGKINDVSNIADGIAVASCEGHGGVKLSPERNRLVPADLRRADGWYEEDCEFHIVARTFPEAFAGAREGGDYWRSRGVEGTFATADASVRQWFPDAWEATTGNEVQPGESDERDRARWAEAFRAEHGDYAEVSRHSKDVDEDGGPLRFRAGDGKIAVIPRRDYNRLRALSEGKAFGVPIPARYLQDVPAAPRLARAPRSDGPVAFDWDSMSERSRAAASKHYRDGAEVKTLAQIVEDRGAVGKVAIAQGSKVRYYASHPGGTLTEIGKGLFDALPAPEDADATRRAQRSAKADRLHTAANEAWDRDARAKAMAQLEQMHREDDAAGDSAVAQRERAEEARRRIEAASTEATFYDDLASATEAASAYRHSDGAVRFDAPATVRQRLEDLAAYGREHRLLG